MSNTPAIQQRKPVDLMLSEAKEQIAAALPAVINSERFIRVALTEIRKNPALQKCDPISVCSAVMQAAQLGLEFGSAVGQLYLIPYGLECTLHVGYRGYLALLMRSGAIKSMSVHAVYEGDFFEYELGLDQKLVHRPCGKQQNLIFVYAVATLPDGSKQFDVMSREAVEHIRDNFSRGKNSDSWRKSFDEMAKKCVIRRLIKMLPITPEVADALEAEKFEVIDEEPRNPQLAQKVAEGQMQFSKAESTAIFDALEKVCLKATELKVDIEDVPDDFTDQTALAWTQIIEERIKQHEMSNRGTN